MLEALGRSGEAQAAREAAARHENHSALDFYFEARLVSMSGRVDQAVDLLTRAMTLAGDDRKLFMHALRLRAGIHENLVSRDEALADLQTLRTLGDDSITLDVRIAGAWMRLSRPDIVDREQRAVVSRVRTSGTRKDWQELLSALRNNRQEGLHASLAEEGANAHPNDDLLQLEAAYAASHRRRHDEAIALCESVIAGGRTERAAWPALAEILQAAGRAEDSVAAATRAVELSPERGRSHELLGNALRMLRRYDEAIPPLEEAIRRAPWNLSARARLARCYEALERWADLERTTRAELAAKPQASECYAMLCEALEAQDRRDDALTATRELLQRVLAIAGSFTARANFHFYLGEFEKALVAARDAMRYRRTKIRTMHFVCMESLRQLGRAGEAMDEGREALKRYPRSLPLHLAMAEACIAAGKASEAISHLDRVLRVQPDHPRAKALRAQVASSGSRR